MKIRYWKVRVVVLAVALVIASGVSWHVIAGADRDDVNAASIPALRNRALTPSVILTTRHLPSRSGCSTSIVSYQSSGLKLYALASKPSSQAPTGGYPVVIFAHGYTNPATYKTDNTQYQQIIAWYCTHNYFVFKPDYRGYGASQGKAANGLYAPDDTYDILNLIASLPTYSGINAHRVGLVGHSMGGGVVLRADVASHSLPIKAVVTMAGAVGSLSQLTYHWGGRVPPDVIATRNQIMQEQGPPNQNPAYWRDGSATNYLADSVAPIQINQGLADASVPPTFAASLDQELTAVGKTHQYFTYPKTDHLFTNQAQLHLFLNRSLSFLNQYDR